MFRCLLATMLSMLMAPAALAETAASQCTPAYYQLADGTGVDIAPVADGQYRWRRLDGTSGLLSPGTGDQWSSSMGWTGRADGKIIDLGGCAKGEITFDSVPGHRVDFATKEEIFASRDAHLAGRLILPPGGGAVPIIVLVHGSEDSSALRFFALQRLLPAQGVGVFVYDKRGTGQSAGTFTHDLHLLAADASAALAVAKRLAGARAGRMGYYGTSQGGWTAPLAASLSPSDFIIVGYGLAISPIEEDREALALDMTRHGYGAGEISKALEIGSAAQAIVRQNFQSGYEAFRLTRDKYSGEPWFRFVRGNVTGIILQTPEAELRANGPRLFAGLIPDYDPMPVLRKLKTPQLWILGGEDIDAPPGETRRRLLDLKKRGSPITVVLYPHAEHGLYDFEADGETRLSTRQPASLQTLLATFARGRPLKASYDDAQVDR